MLERFRPASVLGPLWTEGRWRGWPLVVCRKSFCLPVGFSDSYVPRRVGESRYGFVESLLGIGSVVSQGMEMQEFREYFRSL